MEFENENELLKLNRTMEISTGTERWLKDQSPLGCSCRPLQAIRKSFKSFATDEFLNKNKLLLPDLNNDQLFIQSLIK